MTTSKETTKEDCANCERYRKAMLLIKRYYKDNALLDTIINMTLNGKDITEDRLINAKSDYEELYSDN